MKKPRITSELLVQLSSAAPARVHRRLDKDPKVAGGWDWTQSGSAIEVDTGKQKVTLAPVGEVVDSLDQVSCNCLLAPKCLHVLACVTLLEVDDSSPPDTSESD
ncbi:MAG: hypothetical protein AAF497_05935, partial [Planctomycetota bacterium]